MLSYYGMTQEQLAGIIDAPFVEPDLTEQYLRDDRYVFSSGKRLDIPEEPITRFDGEVRPFHTTKSPVFDSNGRVVLLVGRSTDITDRKKMEESLGKIEQERAALLEREKEARSAAERANQVKDEFLAMLSHELRTPLSTILAWTQLLRAGKLETAETMRGLEILEQSAKTQGQLIDDLLDISRIRAGKLTLNIKEFDPAIVIADAIDSTRSLADSKSVKIETTIIPAGQRSLQTRFDFSRSCGTSLPTPSGFRLREQRFGRSSTASSPPAENKYGFRFETLERESARTQSIYF